MKIIFLNYVRYKIVHIVIPNLFVVYVMKVMYGMKEIVFKIVK